MSNYFSDLKGADWINLANMGTNLLGGLAQGKQAERQAGESAAEFAYRQAQDAYARRLQARSGIGSALQDQTLARRDAASQTLNAMPLGAEQALVAQMARARGLSGVAENFRGLTPTDPRIAGAIRPSSNILSAFTTPDYRNAISGEATARSIAERRKAIAGVNPDFQFGSMGDYGLPSTFDSEVSGASNRAGADRLARENQLMQLLTAQMQEASQPLYTAPSTQPQTQETEKKGTPWWKKVLKVASVAAPFALAPFTGGLSLAAQAGIGAGIGAAGQIGSGGGLKDAIIGGSVGAGTGALAGKMNQNRMNAGVSGGPVLGPPTSLMGSPSIPAPASYLDDIMRQATTGGPVLQPTGAMFQAPPQAPRPVSRPQQAQVQQPQMSLPPMRPMASRGAQVAPTGMAPTGMGANRPTAMRAPTGIERFRDATSPVTNFLGSLGMPGASSVSTTQPYSPSPYAPGQPSAFSQVSQSPIGSAVLGSLTMPNAAVRSGQQLLGPGPTPGRLLNPGSSVNSLPSAPTRVGLPAGNPQRALPQGQYNMPGPRTFNLPATTNGTGYEQSVVQDMLAAMQRPEIKNDPETMRFFINYMQQYLQRIP